jgi:LysM repeat protein
MKKYLILALLFVFLIGSAPYQEETLPDYAFVDGIVSHGQTYPLSCESRSAADLAGYWGVPVRETEFFDRLPRSDNPEAGFVGNVFGTWGQTPPNPYGVHAPPIANLLQQYGLDAQPHKGMTLRELKTEIANGRPVIVWVIGRVWSGTPKSYTAIDGSVVTVAAYEHSMLAYGYDLSGIYLIDAGSGGRASYSYETFRTSWGVLENLAVTVNGVLGDAPPAPPKIDDLGDTYVVQPGDYLSKLASRWGISWQDLAALNGLTYPYTIHPGQVLYTGQGEVPQEPKPTATPAPTAAPTAVPQPTPRPTSTPQPPANKYEVQRGDHLMQIARELDLDWKEIASINRLTYPYLVYPGQELILPGGEGGAGSSQQPAPTEVEVTYEIYTVGKGEHLMQIARELDIEWKSIAELNGLQSPYTLHPGQELKLPGRGSEPPPPPPVEDEPPESEFSGQIYIVQPGDYLYALARTFGLNWQTLASVNQISYPYIVYPGQEIEIP